MRKLVYTQLKNMHYTNFLRLFNKNILVLSESGEYIKNTIHKSYFYLNILCNSHKCSQYESITTDRGIGGLLWKKRQS